MAEDLAFALREATSGPDGQVGVEEPLVERRVVMERDGRRDDARRQRHVGVGLADSPVRRHRRRDGPVGARLGHERSPQVLLVGAVPERTQA